MAENLQRALDRNGAKDCHLVAHSFAGVDARCAISMYGAQERVQSLTTICSPHHGMKLIDQSKQTDEYDLHMNLLARVFEILGITDQAA